MTSVRPVAARAILTAFSTASAPVENRIGLGLAREGRELVQPLAELDIGLVGHDLEGGVGEGVELLLHRRDHLRMAVAGVEHGDAAGEIDEALAVACPRARSLRRARQRPDRRWRRRAEWPRSAGLERCIAGHGNPSGKMHNSRRHPTGAASDSETTIDCASDAFRTSHERLADLELLRHQPLQIGHALGGQAGAFGGDVVVGHVAGLGRDRWTAARSSARSSVRHTAARPSRRPAPRPRRRRRRRRRLPGWSTLLIAPT